MRASMINHKSNLNRIIHHSMYSGTTMSYPIRGFMVRDPKNRINRTILAIHIRELRQADAIPKGWIRLPEQFINTLPKKLD